MRLPLDESIDRVSHVRVAGAAGPDEDAVMGAPVPRVLLGVEPVTIDRSAGFGAMLETIELPVARVWFDYGNQRISACDPRDRFFKAAAGGMQVVLRDTAAEARAGQVLESFGAVDLECSPDHALPPGVIAHYLLRCDGDVHDHCGFSTWVVPQLRALGWRVDFEEDYPYRVVENASWYAHVEPVDERPDWFARARRRDRRSPREPAAGPRRPARRARAAPRSRASSTAGGPSRCRSPTGATSRSPSRRGGCCA